MSEKLTGVSHIRRDGAREFSGQARATLARLTPAQSDCISRQDLLILGACCAAVAAAFAILWAHNDSLLYSKVGDLDTWYYVAYGLHWGDPQFLQGYYKGSRLPWILYEFIHYQLLGPERAVVVVRLGCYLFLFAGNYFFARRLFDRSVSAFSSVGLVLWTHIHASGGADYQNAICGPLFVWCAYTTLRPTQEHSSPLLFMIPGGLYLALVVTNPFYLNLALVFPTLFLFAWRQWKDVRYLLLSCLWAIIGTILAFALMAFVNKLAGRGFFFTSALFIMTKQLAEGANTWWKGWGPWPLEMGSSYLGPIAAMLLVSAAEFGLLFRKKRWGPSESGAAVLHGLYVFHVLLWVAWQAMGQTTLDYSYFAHPLWVLWFWSLAAVLAVSVRGPDVILSSGYILLAVVAVICGTVIVLQRGAPVYDILSGMLRYHVLEAGVATLIFYAAIVVSGAVARAAVIASFVILYPVLDLVAGTWTNYYYRSTACAYGVEGFRAIVNASEWVGKYVATPEDALFWWDDDESMPDQPRCPRHLRYRDFGYPLATVASGSKVLGPAWPTRPVDAIPHGDIENAAARRHIVAVVTSNPENVKKMRERFARQALALELIDQRNFHSETLDFSVYLLRVVHPPN
jgi:hypothetical protein